MTTEAEMPDYKCYAAKRAIFRASVCHESSFLGLYPGCAGILWHPSP